MAKGKEIANAYIALGADTKGIKQGVKKANKEVKQLGGQMAKLGPIVAAAFSARAIYGMITALADTAKAMEAIDRKASIVFGDYKQQVEEVAAATATSMGMTRSEFMKSSAAIGDLLIPMQFTRKEAAGMSTDMIQLSGALAEWSAGTFTATETSEVLAKAMLGEREQLKMLGISIMETDVQGRLLEKGQKKLTGTALQQAKAQATLELIMEKSTDAQTAFADGAGTMTRNSAELQANMGTLKELLATQFTPALENVSGWMVKISGSMVDMQTKAQAFGETLDAALEDEDINRWHKFWARMDKGGQESLVQVEEGLEKIRDLGRDAAERLTDFDQGLALIQKIADKIDDPKLGQVMVEAYKKRFTELEVQRALDLEKAKQAEAAKAEAARAGIAKAKGPMDAYNVSQMEFISVTDQLVDANKEFNKDLAETQLRLLGVGEALAANAALARDLYIPLFETLDDLLWATGEDWGMMGNIAVAATDSMVDAALNAGGSMMDMAKAAAGAAKKTIAAYIAEGVAAQVKGAMASLPPPFGLVLAGIAGAAAAALFNSIIPSFALGGGAASPMMAMIGDHRGASRYNPEAVLSVDQIQKMVGAGSGSLRTYIEGDKIAIAYESYKRGETDIK